MNVASSEGRREGETLDPGGSGAGAAGWLTSRTREALGLSEGDACELEELFGGGSDRRFYRARLGGGAGSVVVCHYGAGREENALYADIARFLRELGLRVPEIRGHDPGARLIWMEDLGDEDLYGRRGASWEERRALYRSALEQAARLHGEGISHPGAAGLRLSPAFDERLYRWEQEYFVERCLGAYFGLGRDERATLLEMPVLREIAAGLAGRVRVLVHRDFQSQNLIVRDGAAHLIDFQGMREGLGEYDVASLLYDPYVGLAEGEREELLGIYAGCAGVALERLRPVYDLCALQRLMQVLGAYGFLGLEKGRTAFLRHIPGALASLRLVAGRMGGLEPMTEILGALPSDRKCPCAPAEFR